MIIAILSAIWQWDAALLAYPMAMAILYLYLKKFKQRGLSLFVVIASCRLLNVWSVKTAFTPDEYWQSLEVAHHLVYDYGYLTWEWTQRHIRSYLHPLLFAALYRLLSLLHLDHTDAFIYAPRIAQSLIATSIDMYTHLFARHLYRDAPEVADHALLFSMMNWFQWYYAVRPYANTLECLFTLMALYYWPWSPSVTEKDPPPRLYTRPRTSLCALLLSVLCCYLRPTSVPLWCIMYLHQLVTLIFKVFYRHPLSRKAIAIQWQRILITIFLTVSVLLALCIVIDSLCYAHWFVIPPWQFVRFNVLEGLSSFYGTHAFHWYLTQGWTVLLLTMLIFVYHALKTELQQHDRRWKESLSCPRCLTLLLVLVTTLMYSLLAHKEFRFIYIALPYMIIFSAQGYRVLVSSSSRKQFYFFFSPRTLWMITLLLHMITASVLSVLYQRGALDVMHALRQHQPRSVLFLTPCHATPFYAFIHTPIPMAMAECTPPLSPSDLLQYRTHTFERQDEQLARFPRATATKMIRDFEARHGALPHAIVTLSSAYPGLVEMLHTNYHYVPVDGQHAFFHQWHMDRWQLIPESFLLLHRKERVDPLSHE